MAGTPAQPRRPLTALWAAILLVALLCPAMENTSAASKAVCPAGHVELAREKKGRDLIIYCGTREQQEILADIKGRLKVIQRVKKGIRAKLLLWQEGLPGYLNSFDEWIALDEAARDETRTKALDLVVGLFTEKLKVRAKKRKAYTQKELDDLWSRFNQTIKDSPGYGKYTELHASRLGKKALKEAEHLGKKAVPHRAELRRWETMDQMLTDLNDAKTVLGRLDDLAAERHARLLISLLGEFLQDPRLKILVADVDFTASALTGNLTAWLARARVNQLLDLGDQRLREVSTLADKYRDLVDENKMLLEERKEILAESTRR